MLALALLALLFNTTYMAPPAPPPVQPQSVGALISVGPSAWSTSSLPTPPCSLAGFMGEGSFLQQNATSTLLCRNSSNPDQLVTTSWFAEPGEWSSPETLGPAPPPSNLVRWFQDPRGNSWIFTTGGGASGGGTAGNGGPPSLWYLPVQPDPTGPPPPYLLYNSTQSPLLDIILVDSGLYALVRTVTGPSPGGGTTLVLTGVAAWGADALPRTPFQASTIPWMLGTLVARSFTAFWPPTNAQKVLYLGAAGAPTTLEIWVKNVTGAKNWFVETTAPLRSTTLAPTRIRPLATGSLLVGTRKGVSQVTLGLGATDTLLWSIPAAQPLALQDMAFGQVVVSPTPTARPTWSASSSRTSTGSVSATMTAAATATYLTSPVPTLSSEATWSATATASSSASATATAAGTATASTTATASASTTRSAGAPLLVSSSLAPTLLPSSTVSTTVSATATASAAPSSEPPPPAAAAAASSLTEAQQYGLGFGLTTALLVVAGVLLGCFGRQCLASTVHWWKQNVIYGKPKPTPRKTAQIRATSFRTPMKPPTDAPNVLQVSINPALLQQQTTLDILQLARQQRLEAIQAQQQQILAEQSARPKSFTRSLANSFKQTYAPMRAPGTSV